MAFRSLDRLLVGFVLAASSAAGQNLVTNGSFEAPIYGDGSSYPVPVTGWSIAPSSGFEVWRNFMGTAAAGDQFLEVAAGGCDTISQTIPTDSGETYQVRFAFSARPLYALNTVEVRWNGQLVGSASADGTSLSEVDWNYHTFTVGGAAGSSTLEFTHVGGCGAGSLLDDVSVLEAATVPVLGPGGLASLAAALAVLACLALRRRSRTV